jgi:hypothetical protein
MVGSKKMSGLGALIALLVLGAAPGCSDDEVLPDQSDAAGDAADAADSVIGDAADAGDGGDAADAVVADAIDGGDAAEAGDGAKPDAGSPADCLPSTDLETVLTLQDTSKCVVAQYSVPMVGLNGLTWGRHGGPLGIDGYADATKPTLLRFQIPGTTTGAANIAKTVLAPTGLPTPTYWGSQAVDLPFFGWTAIAYTGNGAGFPGELVMVDGAGAFTRYDVNGLLSMNAVGLSGGRLLYTGLSPLATSASSTNVGAFYAADSCGTATVSPRLLPNGDSSCKAPAQVATWQAGTSGPVTKDASENVFAGLQTFGTSQEIRGFERSTIAHNAAPTAGNAVATIAGGGTELAADGKTLFFQPMDFTSFAAQDVVAIDYTVDASAKKITGATPRSFLKLVKAGTSVSLIADAQGRLWVAVPKAGTGATESWFFVLRDKTP